MKKWFIIFIFSFLSLLQLQTFAFDINTEIKPVTIELTSEENLIQPGRPFWVLMTMRIDEGWHAYWKNPGDTGFPTTIEWELPEGFSASEVHWPYPEKIELNDSVSYGHHDEVLLLTEINPPKNLKVGDQVDLKASVRWLVCSDSTCLPGEESISFSMEITDRTPALNDSAATQFDSAREKLPRIHEHLHVSTKEGTALIELNEHRGDFTTAYFYPEIPGVVAQEGEELLIKKKADSHFFEIKLSDATDDVGHPFNGLLVLKGDGVDPVDVLQVEIPMQEDAVAFLSSSPNTDPSSIAASPHAFQGGFLMALLLAFLGGLLLNLMPCVLPVISLKIFSFVKMAGEDRKKVMQHGILFTLGVLVSFWALAGALIALQASGAAVGWGFQLQEPIFVALLIAVLFVFSLNLFGVFEFGTMFSAWAGQKESESKSSASGATAAFLSGILATAVATPCTGPFMGTALGFAMTLSAPLALLVFTALGLGMAFPYLAISAYPPLIRFLPKPGNWMITFKEILGFCMVATSIWLLWVFALETSLMGLMVLIAGLFILSVGSWIYGKWGTPLKKRVIRIIGYAFTLIAMATGISVVAYSTKFTFPVGEEMIAMNDTADSRETNIRRWIPFSKEKLEKYQSEGTPVFIDFTAQWCLICQANHLVLSTSDVSERMAELGVVKMKADFTKSDPEIASQLQKFGRSGVPLYLLYDGKSGSEPIILPQMLTPDQVLNYLETVAMP